MLCLEEMEEGGIKIHGQNLFAGVVEGIASHLEPDHLNTIKQCKTRLETEQSKSKSQGTEFAF